MKKINSGMDADSNKLRVNMSLYRNELGLKNKLRRAIWNVVYIVAFRPFGLSVFKPWRFFLLRCFGAKLHPTANIYSSVKIWAPWNLEMGAYSCLAPHVDCYNPALVKIGAHSTISQKTYLCTSSHDITKPTFPLLTAPIIIEDQVWIAADSFVGMGVTIGQGAVVGARSCVFRDVEPWSVGGGNPVQFIKKRIIQDN